jgi:hypothetical protein
MNESRPEWYGYMKSGPLPRKTFTEDNIAAIEKAAFNGAANSRLRHIRKVSILAIPLCAMLLLLLFLPLGRQSVGDPLKGISLSDPSAGSISADGKVWGANGSLIAMDRNWLVSEDFFKLYQSYSKSESDELLRELVPMDVFKLHMMASQMGDRKTSYALLIKGPEYGTPTLEEYLADIAKDGELEKRTKTQWAEWKKTYRLQEEITGDKAIIRLTTRAEASGPIAEDERLFRLVKNEAGIWKVGWLAMQ